MSFYAIWENKILTKISESTIFSLQVAPVTIHPTIDKAAHYFGLEVIHVPVTSDFRADVSAMSKVIIASQFHRTKYICTFIHSAFNPINDLYINCFFYLE